MTIPLIMGSPSIHEPDHFGVSSASTSTSISSSARKSVRDSFRKLGISRKSTNKSISSTESPLSNPPSAAPAAESVSRSAAKGASQSNNPFIKRSKPTRRPEQPSMDISFSLPSNEPPPAYTPSAVPAAGLSSSQLRSPSPSPSANTTSTCRSVIQASTPEDPYAFLSTFDTIFLIDDSGSMAGRSWSEVSSALRHIAPICTSHDTNGIDIYFLNHRTRDAGSPATGVAPTGYRNVRSAADVERIFRAVRPGGGTPTGTRCQHILKPYLRMLGDAVARGGGSTDVEDVAGVKPLNVIVLTDGVPSDDVESVLLSAARKLDRMDAPSHQVGLQFFQVGNEDGAREALKELDDELGNMVEGGVRDMVDTVTWTGGPGGKTVGLTGDAVLKAVLGAVVKRLDRRRVSGEIMR